MLYSRFASVIQFVKIKLCSHGGNFHFSFMQAVKSKEEAIEVRGARVHNLKNISFSLPINKMTVVTGVSGSGKSSLAFDTLYAEGQRRYVESLSAYARQFLERMDKPDVDAVSYTHLTLPTKRIV